MVGKRNKKIKFYYISVLLIIIILFLFFYNMQNKKKIGFEPISINLLTSTHPSLNWKFIPLKSNINITPGDITTVEYVVENLGNEESTGIATFAYFPNSIGNYINKLNCFCYDAQTLKPNEKNKFTLVIFIDPEVTKNSKTKNLKEATIQFIFFDYKKYKEKKS